MHPGHYPKCPTPAPVPEAVRLLRQTSDRQRSSRVHLSSCSVDYRAHQFQGIIFSLYSLWETLLGSPRQDLAWVDWSLEQGAQHTAWLILFSDNVRKGSLVRSPGMLLVHYDQSRRIGNRAPCWRCYGCQYCRSILDSLIYHTSSVIVTFIQRFATLRLFEKLTIPSKLE